MDNSRGIALVATRLDCTSVTGSDTLFDGANRGGQLDKEMEWPSSVGLCSVLLTRECPKSGMFKSRSTYYVGAGHRGTEMSSHRSHPVLVFHEPRGKLC